MLTKQPSRPICSNCMISPARPNGTSVRGFQRWHKLCNSCARQLYVKPKSKSTSCQRCGFVAEHSCQLDLVDHRTLCACCHRLEMHLENHQRRIEKELTADCTVDWQAIRL